MCFASADEDLKRSRKVRDVPLLPRAPLGLARVYLGGEPIEESVGSFILCPKTR